MTESSSEGLPSAEDVFNDALDLAVTDRSSFLDRTCKGYPELRIQVERMLRLADDRPEILVPPPDQVQPDVLGKYRIVAERGRGGMGIVYEAVDTQLDRTVALKILPADFAQDPASFNRFQREARLLAALNNEHIATLYTLEESRGIDFLTMEYIEGKTLAEVLRTRGPISLAETLDLCVQIAQALEQAHAHRIIHRDLKPSNVMITGGGSAKVLDFGIAKALDAQAGASQSTDAGSTEHSGLIGTPGYMSPEQAAGSQVDDKADLWAFGCLLYECLTGERAARESDWSGVDDAVFRGPNWELLPRGTPPEIRVLLQSCLEVDPNHRVGSAGEVRKILETTQSGLTRARMSRWPLIVAVLAVAAVLGFGVTAILRFGERGNLAVLEYEEHTVRAIDLRGRVIWTHEFSGSVVENIPDGFDASPLTVVRDGGRSIGSLVATSHPGMPDALWFLDPASGEVLWHRRLDWIEPLSVQDQLLASWTQQIDWPGEQLAVAVGLRDGIWYNSAVRFLSLEGHDLGTYYHAGPMFLYGLVDDGSERGRGILLYGLNSSARFVREIVPFDTRTHLASLAILDPGMVSGQAFPHSKGIPEGRDWPGMEPAQERSYLLIPQLHPDVHSRISQIDLQGERLSGTATSDGGNAIARFPDSSRYAYQVLMIDGRIFRLGRDLRPLMLYVPLHSAADSLYRIGEARFLPLFFSKNGNVEMIEVPVSF